MVQFCIHFSFLSSDKKSAENLRLKIDELIGQKSKMLSNTLSKKYLNEEANAPGSNLSIKKPKLEKKPKEEPVAVTQILSISDEEADDDSGSGVEEDHLKELEDLMCVICKLMDVSARNRLVECADCHSLYHQQCHKPQISETDANDQENPWYCSSCKGKTISTNSSPAKSSSSSSTNYESSSSSKKSSKKSSKSGSSTTVTPTINVVHADRKHH